MKKYRLTLLLARFIIWSVLLTLGACTHGNDLDQDKSVLLGKMNKAKVIKKRSSADRLFEAIVHESHARKFKMDTSSAKFRIVSTQFEKIAPRLRKRRIMRVVLLPRGGALHVRVEYQRNLGAVGESTWVALEAKDVRKEAAKEEIELARAIEKRFHTMSR